MAHVVQSMPRIFVRASLLLASATSALLAQTPVAPINPIPDYNSVKHYGCEAPKETKRTGFVKDLRTDSFGYGSAPTGTGFEKAGQLSGAGSLTTIGLECARCIFRPTMDRTRYTMAPFAGRVVWRPMDGRLELAAGEGGVNAWKPDNTTIEPGRRDTAYNDAWQLQNWLTGSFSVDGKRRIWLGGAARTVENFGAGLKHWGTFGGSATFLLGH